jgi:hypothetical protein
MNINILALWDMTPHNLLSAYQRLRGTWYLLLQGTSVEPTGSFETLVTTYNTTHCVIIQKTSFI